MGNERWTRGRRLTSRERILLGILMILVFWTAALRLAIEPYGELKEELCRAQEEHRDRESAFGGLTRTERDRMEQIEEGLYEALDTAFMDRSLQRMAGEAGVRILKMEIGNPERTETGLEKTRIAVELQAETAGEIKQLAGAIDSQEKSAFLTDFSAEQDETGQWTGRMEVVYCYVREK